MYKLTKLDKFNIDKLLIIRLNSVEKYNRIKDNIYKFNNEELGKFISLILITWDKELYKRNQSENDIYDYCKKLVERLLGDEDNDNDVKIKNNEDYFSKEKIEGLRKITNTNFDLSKLIRILEEVNICYQNQCYFGISSLQRMLIDHIPPIFGKKNFDAVVSECSFGNKFNGETSDKKVIMRLQELSKNISDSHLHSQIGKKEVLPNKNTINFKVEFDTLLKHIILELIN